MTDMLPPRAYSPKEQAVFQAVLALADRGVDVNTVKVQQIADAASVGKGTLYEYFKSKEEILECTMTWCIGQELDALEALTDRSNDLDALINGAADYALELVTHRAPHYKMLASVLVGSPQEKLYPLLGQIAGRLQQLLGRAWQLALRTAPLAGDVDEDFFHTSLFNTTLNYAAELFRTASMGILTPEREQRSRRNLVRSLKKLLYCPLPQ